MEAEIRWDHERELRTGLPEIVFGPGKSASHLRTVFSEGSGLRLASRLSDEQMDALEDLADVDRRCRMAVRDPRPLRAVPAVHILTAGTADIPVALEAETTLKALGIPTCSHFDVGIAGIHRLYAVLPELAAASSCIVVAGMEGALPGIVAGLIRPPVIAVPTSIGTGVAQGGMVALNSMLASCSPGLAVVNIDNGLGAACLAAKMLSPATLTG